MASEPRAPRLAVLIALAAAVAPAGSAAAQTRGQPTAPARAACTKLPRTEAALRALPAAAQKAAVTCIAEQLESGIRQRLPARISDFATQTAIAREGNTLVNAITINRPVESFTAQDWADFPAMMRRMMCGSGLATPIGFGVAFKLVMRDPKGAPIGEALIDRC